MLTYEWEQVSGTHVELSDRGAARPTLVAPQLLAGEDLVFQVTATDGTNFVTERVMITVEPVPAVARQLEAPNASIPDELEDPAPAAESGLRGIGMIWGAMFAFLTGRRRPQA